MNRASTVFALACCAALLVAGCQSADRAEVVSPLAGPAVPWTDKPVANDPGRFHFAIVSDLTGDERPGVFRRAVRTLNLLQPEFVVSVGDLVQGYTDDPAVLAAQWQSFDERLADLDMRFFHVSGNHDVGGKMPEEPRRTWMERFGATHYWFTYRDCLFVFLDTELIEGAARYADASAAQVAMVRRALAAHPSARWTFVLMHKPVYLAADPGPWGEIESLLADRPHSVFNGHVHAYTKHERHGRSYITLMTTGGGNWGGGPRFGMFQGVTWVTVTAEGPVVAHVEVDHVHDENLLVADQVERLKQEIMRLRAEREARQAKPEPEPQEASP